MSAAGPSAEPGLNATQAQQVRQMIMDIAQGAHDEAIQTARQSLEATRDAMMAAADEFAKKQEASKAEHERVIEGLATRQQEIENSLSQANTSFSAMGRTYH